MNDILINYINQTLLNNSQDDKIDVEDDLLGGGILDSLGMMKLILFIEKEFKLKVPPEDMTIENFMSVQNIGAYLTSRLT